MKHCFTIGVVATLTLAACGADGASTSTPDDETRTVDVVMTDNAFEPSRLEVTAGETVRFVFRNDGTQRHEAVFGTEAEQLEHHTEMQAEGHDTHGTSEPDHGDDPAHTVVVEPGASGEITHTFEASGVTVIGCHEPGHWEAGMRLDVAVG